MLTKLRIQDFDDPDFDPIYLFDHMYVADGVDNVYSRLAELRAQAPVHKIAYNDIFGLPSDLPTQDLIKYTIVGSDEIAQVFMNVRLYHMGVYRRTIGQTFGKSLTAMDPPEHSGYRRLFQQAFLPHVVSKWGENLVDPVVTALMDKFVGRGKADLVQEFTKHYPFHVIYRQLDLPEQDLTTFHRLAVGLTCIGVDVPHGLEASQKLGAYYHLLLQERYNNPGDDMISMMALAEVDGERLPEEVMVSFLRQLMNAAGDTTYRATSNLLVGLLTNPHQLEALRRDRSLIPAAIEEGLRWDGPITITFRMTACDTNLGGVDIPAGAELNVCNAAYNRDPARYSDPDKFDIFRKAPRNMAFALGAHVCIGQHLARLEMTRALHAILDRLPNLRLDPDMPPPRILGTQMRAPEHLHVCFDA